MNHKNTDDILRIITSSGADVDVVLNYQLYSGIEESNDYLKITAAGTYDVSLNDGAKTKINSLYVKNIDGAVSNTIGIYKRFGGVDHLIFGCILAAGEEIIYTDYRGWVVYTATGKQKVETGSGGGSVAWGDITGTLSDQTDLQSALDAKEDTITATTSADYYRGDKTFQTLNKAAVGLGNVDNTSDVNKPVSTLQAAADAATLASAQSYADGLVVGLWDDRGNYDPTGTSDYPASGGSGSAGAILKGDVWTISVAGTISGYAVNIGDTVRALVNTPGLTDANWAIGENNIGYVPENIANKDASGGYAGLTLLKINFLNALGTFTSFFTNANTAARTYTFQDRNGTIADDTDLAGKQPLDSDLTTIAALTPSDDDFMQRKAGAWANRTVAQVKTDLSLAGSNSGDETATTIGALVNAAGAATPNNGDFVATAESGGLLKKITWTNVKAFLKTYFDTIYQPLSAVLTDLASRWTAASASGPASLQFHEDTDNGSNKITVIAPAALGADFVNTLPAATDTLVGKATTDTLTNKRVTPRVTTEASSATPTINTDNSDAHSITALAAAITSFTTNLSGTPTDFQRLIIRIKDNGTIRAIAWGASFAAKGVALPTTTVASKVLTVGFIWDGSVWGCIASAQEA